MMKAIVQSHNSRGVTL